MRFLLAAVLLLAPVTSPDKDCGISGRFCYPYWVARLELILRSHPWTWPPR